MITAERLMLAGGISAFVITLLFVRRRTLREKYAVMWLIVASVLLLVGLFPQVLMRVADASRLSYPSAVLFVSLSAIYFFAMSISVSVSRQHQTIVRLTQELGLLREKFQKLEQTRCQCQDSRPEESV